MKRKLTGIGLLIGGIALLCWATINAVDSITYGLESGDLAGGLLRMGIPILPILAYIYFVHKIPKWLNI